MNDAFGRLANLVACTLGVPAALATSVEGDRVRVPGAVGLGQPGLGELGVAYAGIPFCLSGYTGGELSAQGVLDR